MTTTEPQMTHDELMALYQTLDSLCADQNACARLCVDCLLDGSVPAAKSYAVRAKNFRDQYDTLSARINTILLAKGIL